MSASPPGGRAFEGRHRAGHAPSVEHDEHDDPKAPLRRLAQALQRAVAASSEVESALRDIRARRADDGDATLLLEVTLAFPPAEDEEEDGESGTLRDDAGAPPPERVADRIAPEDRDFLRSLRIRLD